MKTKLLSMLSLASAMAFSSTASAATIYEIAIPGSNMYGWGVYDTRPGGITQVNGDAPRNGDGSVELIQSGPSTAKADIATFWNPSSNKFNLTTTVGGLNQLKFDYYRSSLSTNPPNQAPGMRMFIATDSNNDSTFGGAGDNVGQLVWERAYQPGAGNTPTDMWDVADLTTGLLWYRNSNTGTNYDVAGGLLTLAQWMDPLVPKIAGTATIAANSQIYGMQASVGSGISGYGQSNIDNFTMGYTGGNTVNTNFEGVGVLSPVPEPTSLVLFGLMGLVGFRRSRK